MSFNDTSISAPQQYGFGAKFGLGQPTARSAISSSPSPAPTDSAPVLEPADQLQASPQGNSLTNVPLETAPQTIAQSPAPNLSFSELAQRSKGYLKPESSSDKARLQALFAQCSSWLEQNPTLKAQITAQAGGSAFLEALSTGAQGQLSSSSIENLQRFLAVSAGINLRFGHHATGIDGKYGPVTHQGLMSFLHSLQASTAEQTGASVTSVANSSPEGIIDTPSSSAKPLPVSVGPIPDQSAQIAQWQSLATQITEKGKRGLEMHGQTEPIYARLLEQVQSTTSEIPASADPLSRREYSIRPRVGQGYQFSNGSYLDAQGRPAQAAAVVFDREHNLLAALDSQGKIIMAVEARNNTNQHFAGRSEQWLANNSIVPETNAPAPNGIYAIGDIYKDSASSGKTFGSNRIVIEGGVITDRQILIHSRDNYQNREIPWDNDSSSLATRTAGCVLLQDPDLQMLSKLMNQSQSAVALVIQGAYAKNQESPQIGFA